ncbi:hypothetical protein ABMA27_002747 [Loxostege sticticalis]|uniref:Uncharacterized protein n=1 Tax=Loxostege sticticalis TaxID=481309 RepID=A0ABR3HUQ7_LOXSC
MRLLLVICLLPLLLLTIAKCKPDDKNCIKLSAQALIPIVAGGISEFGMEPLDPLPIKTIDGSTKDVKLIASDVIVTGLKGCDVHQITRENSKINVDLLCTVDVKGDYEIKGKILFLPVDGKGNLIVSLSKVLISVQADIKEVELNGKKHWDIMNWAHSFDLKDRANIELTNLFAGSEQLTKAMKEMFGGAANEIVKEVGPPIVKAITGEVVNTVNKFFHNVPVEELTIQ